MDLIGEFYPPTSKGHRYALTVVDMLTGFISCAPLKSKKAEEIVQTYLDEAITGLEDQGKSYQIMTLSSRIKSSKKF